MTPSAKAVTTKEGELSMNNKHQCAAVFVLLSLAATPSQGLRAFLSSAMGSGDLGSWPQAGSAIGIDAGDAICVSLAQSAGLGSPTSYRAWLSDSASDAYCRVHGLFGKVADDCGQATLPAAAGPWFLIEGAQPRIFAAQIPLLLSPHYQVFTPAQVLETGAAVVQDEYWTGTKQDGTYDEGFGNACEDWTSGDSGDQASIGSTAGTGTSWTDAGGSGHTCSLQQRLLCMQAASAAPVGPSAFYSWGRLAFHSSATGSGRLQTWPQANGLAGLAAGDQICRTLAVGAGLRHPESFKAWLSTATVDARDRFQHDGPWIRPDRTRIASNIAQLTHGFLNTSLNVNELGDYGGGSYAWTGTTLLGTVNENHCADWTSASAGLDGDVGYYAFADSRWTDYPVVRNCSFPESIYCLQDLPLIFGDGFEAGSTITWTLP